MVVPNSGSNNTSTVSWRKRKTSTINPVVADLLCICTLHSRKILNPSIFYHPGQENCMADDASCLFNLSETSFLTHMSVVYPQLHGLWQTPPPDDVNYFPCDLHYAKEALHAGTTQDVRQHRL